MSGLDGRGGGPQGLPWALRDVGRLVWFEVLSVLVILACSIGARHTRIWADQLYWIVGGIVGLLLAGAGWAVWVLIGARSLRERQQGVSARIQVLVAADGQAAVTGGAVSSTVLLLSGRGMKHFHRAECQLVRGRVLAAAPLAQHLDAARLPCGLCRP